MAQFIELHLMATPDQPFMLNIDRVVYIDKLEKGSLIHLSSVNISGQTNDVSSHLFTLHVYEEYFTLKEIFRCK